MNTDPPAPRRTPAAARNSTGGPARGPVPTRVEDTASADVGDNAANEATDALIDEAGADPVRPGERADAHRHQR